MHDTSFFFSLCELDEEILSGTANNKNLDGEFGSDSDIGVDSSDIDSGLELKL